MKYTLVRKEFTSQTPSGVVRRSGVELDRFVLVPVSEDLGESLEAALQPGSSFNRQLDSLDPAATTITVWTYPDSFPHFRQLKEYLKTCGFLTAARPMPAGHPISGSPHGSRSAAQ